MVKIGTIRGNLSSSFRKKRMKLFMRTFAITRATTILDVGGTAETWQTISSPAQITLVNIRLPDSLSPLPANMRYIQGDGTALQFYDQSFDIVFSNSVIEHLYTLENQKKFANEVARVGRSLWIQTPSRSFFFEPHYMAPMIHYLPKTIQKKFVRYFTFWGLLARPSKNYVENMVNEINLLSFKEFQSLFPSCFIHQEKFLQIATKSFIAIKK
jgi:hypothetical protein